MGKKAGEVFSPARDNAPISGCTVSEEIIGGRNCVICCSMADNTDISAEIYPYHKLIIMIKGEAQIYTAHGTEGILHDGDCILTRVDVPTGIRTAKSAVYTEITVWRDDNMNELIKPGEVFSLAELVPYKDGKIVNMDVAANEKMKLALMAFDAGTGLSEHAAPGEALIFALDGEGLIGYEGNEHHIKAGENFRFAKGGMHYIKAEKRFKMALLLTLE